MIRPGRTRRNRAAEAMAEGDASGRELFGGKLKPTWGRHLHRGAHISASMRRRVCVYRPATRLDAIGFISELYFSPTFLGLPANGCCWNPPTSALACNLRSHGI